MTKRKIKIKAINVRTYNNWNVNKNGEPLAHKYVTSHHLANSVLVLCGYRPVDSFSTGLLKMNKDGDHALKIYNGILSLDFNTTNTKTLNACYETKVAVREEMDAAKSKNAPFEYQNYLRTLLGGYEKTLIELLKTHSYDYVKNNLPPISNIMTLLERLHDTKGTFKELMTIHVNKFDSKKSMDYFNTQEFLDKVKMTKEEVEKTGILLTDLYDNKPREMYKGYFYTQEKEFVFKNKGVPILNKSPIEKSVTFDCEFIIEVENSLADFILDASLKGQRYANLGDGGLCWIDHKYVDKSCDEKEEDFV